MEYRNSRSPSRQNQTFYALGLLTLVWVFFLFRLYTLQVSDRRVYEVKSEENRIVRLTRLAPRGEILDAHGRLLAASRFSVDLVVPNRKGRLRDINEIATRASPIVQVKPERLRDAYYQSLKKTYAYQPAVLLQNLSETQTIRLGESLWNLPDVRLQKRLARWYPNRETLSHVIGYVNEVSKEDMDADPNYKLGGVIGRSGIEEILEPHLRGRDGWDWVEVDAQGRIRRDIDDLPEADPMSGGTAHLTLDLKLSRFFEDAFGDSNGFGILMDANSGAIRAIFSRPGFDPNRLVKTEVEYIRQMQTDINHPFFNRAVQSAFPPGSTFKTISFVASCEGGLANAETRYYCSGRYRLGKRIAECWKKQGHGYISLIPALAHSCNVFFYNIGLELGGERMIAAGHMFRLGERTGIILSGEPPGILPSAEWKKRRTGEEWTRGDDLNMSIGQGFLLVTPLQQVTLMASLFNGGRMLRPYLVEKVVSPSGEVTFAEGMQVRSTVAFSPATLSMVHEALHEVVLRGTGYRAGHNKQYRLYPVRVYGKTGTVQRAGRDAVESAGVEPEDHGWFLCYIETGKDKYTAVVMKEAAGHGGTVAAPVIGQFIEKLIKDDPYVCVTQDT